MGGGVGRADSVGPIADRASRSGAARGFRGKKMSTIKATTNDRKPNANHDQMKTLTKLFTKSATRTRRAAAS